MNSERIFYMKHKNTYYANGCYDIIEIICIFMCIKYIVQTFKDIYIKIVILAAELDWFMRCYGFKQKRIITEKRAMINDSLERSKILE